MPIRLASARFMFTSDSLWLRVRSSQYPKWMAPFRGFSQSRRLSSQVSS